MTTLNPAQSNDTLKYFWYLNIKPVTASCVCALRLVAETRLANPKNFRRFTLVMELRQLLHDQWAARIAQRYSDEATCWTTEK
jgi:hypothetical protein